MAVDMENRRKWYREYYKKRKAEGKLWNVVNREKRREWEKEYKKKKRAEGQNDYFKYIKPNAEIVAKRKQNAKKWNNSEKGRLRSKALRDELKDHYVKRILVARDGFKNSELTQDIIETKRLILKTKRL